MLSFYVALLSKLVILKSLLNRSFPANLSGIFQKDQAKNFGLLYTKPLVIKPLLSELLKIHYFEAI